MVNIGGITDGIVVSANVSVGIEVIPTVGTFGSAVGWGHGREVVIVVVASSSCLVTSRSVITCSLIQNLRQFGVLHLIHDASVPCLHGALGFLVEFLGGDLMIPRILGCGCTVGVLLGG